MIASRRRCRPSSCGCPARSIPSTNCPAWSAGSRPTGGTRWCSSTRSPGRTSGPSATCSAPPSCWPRRSTRPRREMTRAYIDREDARIPYEIVDDAPVQEVVIQGGDIDLSRIPIVTNCEKDSGAFISGGITTVRVPGSDGVHNSGIYRMMVHSPTTLGMSYEKHTHIGRVHRHFEEQDRAARGGDLGRAPSCLPARLPVEDPLRRGRVRRHGRAPAGAAASGQGRSRSTCSSPPTPSS